MNDLLDETVLEAWMYVLETMFICCSVEAMADADFAKFVGNLQRHYPKEFEVVMEVLEAKDFLK